MPCHFFYISPYFTSLHLVSCDLNSSYTKSAHLISYHNSYHVMLCYVMSSNHFFRSPYLISPHLISLHKTGALLLMSDNSAPIRVKPMFAHSREVRPSLEPRATTHQQHCGLQYPYLHFTMTKLCFNKTVRQRQRAERSESGRSLRIALLQPAISP